MLWVFAGMAPAYDGSTACPPSPTPETYLGRSVIGDWQLMCDKSYQAATISSLFFFGFMMGSVCMGFLSDRRGRKPALLVSMVLLQVSAALCAMAAGPVTFGAGRLVCGLGMGGSTLGSFVWNAEFMGRQRSVLTVTSSAAFAAGVSTCALAAQYLEMWRPLCWATFVANLPSLVVAFGMPESPKWLEVTGHVEDAQRILLQIAKVNGLDGAAVIKEGKVQKSETKDTKPVSNASPGMLLVSPLAGRMLAMSGAFFATAIAYYGLILNAGAMGSDIYATTILGACAELPAYLLVYMVVDRPAVGRRKLCVYSLVGGGLACICGSFFSSDGWEVVVTAMVGRFCISVVFAVIYLWGAELLPTNIRGVGMGLQSLAGRASAVAAPFVVAFAAKPMLYMGIPALLAGVACATQPETVGRPMPDTLEELLAEEHEAQMERKRLYP